MEDHHGHNMNMENKTKTEPMMTMTMTVIFDHLVIVKNRLKLFSKKIFKDANAWWFPGTNCIRYLANKRLRRYLLLFISFIFC